MFSYSFSSCFFRVAKNNINFNLGIIKIINYYTYVSRCATEWYNFSPRLKSLLIITLYRTNVPYGLKAGNMIPLCIETYAAVSIMKIQIYLHIYIFIRCYAYTHKTIYYFLFN